MEKRGAVSTEIVINGTVNCVDPCYAIEEAMWFSNIMHLES